MATTGQPTAKDTILRLHTQQAAAYLKQGIADSAVFHYVKAASLTRSDSALAGIHRKIGVAYALGGNLEKAMGYFERSAAHYHQVRDSLSYAKCLNNLGNCFSGKGAHRTAIHYYQQALQIKTAIGAQPGQLLRNLGDEFFHVAQPDSGIHYLTRALDHTTDSITRSAIYNNLAAGWLDLGNLSAALGALNKAVHQGPDPATARDIAYNFYATYHDLGNGDSALAWHLRFHEQHEQLTNYRVQMHLEELASAYEHQLNVHELEVLQSENRVKAHRLAHKETMIRMVMAMLVALLVGGAIIFRQAQLLRGKNRALTREVQSLEQALEVHLRNMQTTFDLTQQDIDLCKLLVLDKKIGRIAEKLKRSSKTVYGYYEAIQVKMGIDGLDALRETLHPFRLR